jgi:hypothetical protein
MGWNSTKDKLPPDMVDVLGYTDADKFKVVSIKNGVWNTYMNVLYWMWQILSQKSQQKDVVERRRQIKHDKS